MRVITAILFYLCGLIWLWRFLDEGSFVQLVIGVVWLAGGIVHTARYIKSRKQSKEE